MKNYRIAIFTVDWNYELVESTLHGLKRYIDEHENVRLCIFDCFGKDQGNEKDHSEYAIFDLPDLTQFDGVLIQSNQIVLRSARDKLARRVAALGLPAISIGCDLEGCISLGIDDRSAQRDIALHVIRDHGARRLVYITGILDNGCPEGALRRDGFLDACRQFDIPEDNITILPGTWRTDDGLRYARRWIEEGNALPDAFVCGNDEMALGVMEALKEKGYRIPEDVLVTGYDNVSSAELSNPRLSTVFGDTAELDYYALDQLVHMVDSGEKRPLPPFGHQLVCSESCGCSETARPGAVRDKYFQQTRFLKSFYALQDEMAEKLFEASDLTELMETVKKNHNIFGCSDVYLCVNDYYFDNYDKSLWDNDSKTFGDQMVLASGDTESFSSVRFPTRQLLPGSMIRAERFLVFYPLHYNTYSIGYVAMDGISEAAKLNLHESIINFLEIAIENVRKKCLLRKLNGVLDDLYVHDALTGLYNRFGYKRFGQRVYERFLVEDGGAQVLFIDMDEMKCINDQYGHDAGDEAIRIVARALESSCGTRDFIMRYGGDEFLAIAAPRERNLEEKIQAAIRKANEKSPFTLSISIGIIRADAAAGRSLDEWVKTADSLMYKRKFQRKSTHARPCAHE